VPILNFKACRTDGTSDSMEEALRLNYSPLFAGKEYVVRTLLLLMAIACQALFAAPPSFALEHRSALIIGNGSYTDSPLRNPANDAEDMADALEAIGFDVTLAVDVNRREMGRSIREFGRRLRDKGGVGLFYYAGHGMQIDNRNYMIPIDSPMSEEDEVPYESVDVGSVLSKMETAGNALNVIILDACRNNPFPNRFRSSARGLARVEAPIGSLIVYSTAPGSVAADGDGRNGIFTSHLLEQLRTPGLSLSETVRRTRAAVVKATARAQVPWESSSLLTDIAFTKPKPEPEKPSKPAIAAVPNNKPEATSSLANLPQPEPAPEPNSLTVAGNIRSLTVETTPLDARVRIMNIVERYQPGMELSSERAYDVLVTRAGYKPWRQYVTLTNRDHRIQVNLESLTVLAEAPVDVVNEEAADALLRRPTKDLPLLSSQPTLPPLSSISGGQFRMGCSAGDKTCKDFEKPAVSIYVPGYRIGQTEVTVAQFSRFVQATAYVTDAEKDAGGFKGCHIYQDKGGISRASSGWVWRAGMSWKNPGYNQSDEHPVTCVSWNDAQAYVNWLSASSGITSRC